MFPQRNSSDELGLKVRRVQEELERIRGVGTVQGIRVVVDAEGRLLSVTVDEEDIILAAYRAALADRQPRVDDAMRELHADPRFAAVSTFTEANTVRANAEQVARRQQHAEDDDAYYEERNQRGWLV